MFYYIYDDGYDEYDDGYDDEYDEVCNACNCLLLSSS
jgi:hypothetical protein